MYHTPVVIVGTGCVEVVFSILYDRVGIRGCDRR